MGHETPWSAADGDSSSSNCGPFRAGDVIAGKYRVDRIVGLGGMGQVVAATHVDLGQQVAIKILLPARASDTEAIERFMREAHAAVRLKSTHVARVFDVGKTHDGLPYIVMELLEGEDLCNVLEQRGRLSVADAVDFVLQACDAVAEAHARGIIHRDIKPENLFLTSRRDGTPCVKVLDFGISKVAGATTPRRGRRALTQDDVVMGSPAYMSPEQVKSSKKADERSDVWSLGVTLYELLTGREPFPGESTPDIFVAILTANPVAPVHLAPGVPPDLSDIVMRCLAKDPNHRFQDVESLAQALLRFATRKPTSIAPGWTNTCPEFRPAGPTQSGATPVMPVPPGRNTMQTPTLRFGGPDRNVPSSSTGPFAPASTTPAGISTTITEHTDQKRGRSLWAYALAGAFAALVAGGALAGLAFRRSHAHASAARSLPDPVPTTAPTTAPSVAPMPPPVVAASAHEAPSASATSPKPPPTPSAATKPMQPRVAPPPPAAPKPSATTLPRHRTAW